MAAAPVVTPATDHDASGRPLAVRGFRRAAVITMITSLSVTALVGIGVLVTGDFGQVQVRILATALLVAGFSIVALCDLALAGRALRVVALVSIGVAVIALALGVVLIWSVSWSGASFGQLSRAFGVAGIWSVSLAQANLLLLLTRRRHPVIRFGMVATVGCIVLTAVLLSLPIVTEFRIPTGETALAFWRAFGIAVILDALGTITVPVLALFLRDAQKPVTPSAPIEPAASGWVRLSGELTERVAREAATAGTTPDQVVAYAVRSHLDAREQSITPRAPGVGEAAR